MTSVTLASSSGSVEKGVSDVLCKRFGLIVGPWASRKGTSLCQHWTDRLNR